MFTIHPLMYKMSFDYIITPPFQLNEILTNLNVIIIIKFFQNNICCLYINNLYNFFCLNNYQDNIFIIVRFLILFNSHWGAKNKIVIINSKNGFIIQVGFL
eukprot:226754_1